MLKVGIYSPYLDTLGGGERYILTVAEAFSKKGKVKIFLDKHLQTLNIDEIKQKLHSTLNLDLSECEFVNAPIGEGSSFFERVLFLRQFDYLVCVTDGSIFYTTAKKSFLHIQSPFGYQAGNSIWGKIKLSSWKGIIYNSNFTKENAQKTWRIKGYVLYPPVEVSEIKPLNKKKQILTVGRFFGFLKEKKHQLLIEVFKDLYKSGRIKDWSFHLAGSAAEGDKEYLEHLKQLAGGFPIVFHANFPFNELVRVYGESSIYWHAMGFLEEDPTKQEHFGITTVEAMAGGCVPVVIKKGGQLEIVEENKSGIFWENVEELKEKTMFLIENKDRRQKLSEGAVERSRQFSKEKFKEDLIKLVNEA